MNDIRSHNRKKTINNIEQAIKLLQANQEKISISAVAKMAGVTPSLIHNTYPDLAEQIRAIIGKSTRKQRNVKHDALVKIQITNRKLRAELIETQAYLAKVVSINQTLLNEIALLKGVRTGKVAPITFD